MVRRLYLAWRLYIGLHYSWHVAWHKAAYRGIVTRAAAGDQGALKTILRRDKQRLHMVRSGYF